MQEIVEKLGELRRLDPMFKVFGASSHRYELPPPLSEKVIAQFETYYRCRLPADYRQFMGSVGDGGAGPHYGLFPLGMQDHGHELSYWNAGYKIVGDPSAPFQLTGPWSVPATFWGQRPDFEAAKSIEEEQGMHDEWNAMLDREYYAPSLMNGAIPICHEGCGLRDWLVLNGKFEGSIWRDCRAEEGGIAPIIGKDGKEMSFRAWYVEWLDASLQSCK